LDIAAVSGFNGVSSVQGPGGNWGTQPLALTHSLTLALSPGEVFSSPQGLMVCPKVAAGKALAQRFNSLSAKVQ